MRIVVDLQGAQTESRTRGIGRYSLSFAQALVRNRSGHEIIIALNGLLSDSILPIRDAFRGLLPQDNIKVWHASGPIREFDAGNEERRHRAEYIREAFLASLKPDVVHVSSLFEGFVDDAATSISSFSSLPTSVTLYDFIPLHHPDRFLRPIPQLERWYRSKFEFLKKSDLLLAISEASADDARKLLDLTTDNVVNVSAACSSDYKPLKIKINERKNTLNKFNINDKFILTSGTLEPHKNLPRLLEAYGRLKPTILKDFQIVLVGKVNASQRSVLDGLAREAGLSESDFVVTGYISDSDLVTLYNLCAVMVFPSYDEGFGLPALEAMSCGAAVIAANASSIPEVIGSSDALFDPHDTGSIADSLARAVTDPSFRKKLKRQGIEQASHFSWDETARKAITALERSFQKGLSTSPTRSRHDLRQTLAYVSPLPPQRTGIAEYSSLLARALSKYYDIVFISGQEDFDLRSNFFNFRIRDNNWLLANKSSVDRVVYHIGNSPFHNYMFELMRDVPGAIVLHDFFLSSVFQYNEMILGQPVWTEALYYSHGYRAVKQRFSQDPDAVRRKFPANMQVLRSGLGVIVHSQHSRDLASTWLHRNFSRDWHTVPMVRSLPTNVDRKSARKSLGLPRDALVVCSMGALDTTKCNDQLLEAFCSSSLAGDPSAILVFVGLNHDGEYGELLSKTIHKHNLQDRVYVTGWVDTATYQRYLSASDIAVQLRSGSRGETSLAVYECMSYGLPTIVNAHGSMSEISPDAVWLLPDEFTVAELRTALEELGTTPRRREQLGARAREVIASRHSPEACALQHFEALERIYQNPFPGVVKLVESLSHPLPDDDECRRLAAAIGKSFPSVADRRQILLDVTQTRRTDLKTGIERVARALTLSLLQEPPEGYRVEPVYLSCEDGKWRYRYARQFTMNLMDCSTDIFPDDLVEVYSGDFLVSMDMSGDAFVAAEAQGVFRDFRIQGVSINAIIFDLLPILTPEFFPPGADHGFRIWLETVLRQDGALCISETTANALRAFANSNNVTNPHFNITWFQQGADIDKATSFKGLVPNDDHFHSIIGSRPTFLMVGTIEPRKGHLNAIASVEKLWATGHDVNLVIVGAEGWKAVQPSERRTIPQIVERIKSHPELNSRLFWLEGISDDALEQLYHRCSCLIAASEGEGFGLPLVEAARHKLPILARDIPIFHEVAGSHATYFQGDLPDGLYKAMVRWLADYENGLHTVSEGMPWITWEESARQMISALLKQKAI